VKLPKLQRLEELLGHRAQHQQMVIVIAGIIAGVPLRQTQVKDVKKKEKNALLGIHMKQVEVSNVQRTHIVAVTLVQNLTLRA